MKNHNYFYIFSKKHWWLYFILSLIPLISLLLLCFCFPKDNTLSDFGAWATIISGLLAYIGSSLISVLLFYNTWSKQYREEKLDYSIDFRNNIDENIRTFHSLEQIPEQEKKFQFEFVNEDYYSKETYEYVRFILNNRSKVLPINIDFCYAEYSIDNEQMKTFYSESKILANFNILEKIENNNNIFYVGINRECIKKVLKADEFHYVNINLYFYVYNNAGYGEYIRLSLKENCCIYSVSRVHNIFIFKKLFMHS